MHIIRILTEVKKPYKNPTKMHKNLYLFPWINKYDGQPDIKSSEFVLIYFQLN